MSSPLRLAYVGLPLGALVLQRAGFAPSFIGVGHVDAAGMRRLRRRGGPHAPLLLGRPNLHDEQIVQALSSARPDVLLSWFWPRRLPSAVLALPRVGAFGVHPSLLPRWRGPDPYFWALYAGDTETGVTLHRLEADYDTGRIVEQRKLAVRAGDTGFSLARRLDRPSLSLLVECVQRLSAGDALEGAPQRDASATLAPFPNETTLRIDWGKPVATTLRLIRAAAPYPGAICNLDGEEVEVLRAEALAGPLPRALACGEAVESSRGVVVRGQDGGILLLEVRREDGSLLAGPAVAELFDGGLYRLR